MMQMGSTYGGGKGKKGARGGSARGGAGGNARGAPAAAGGAAAGGGAGGGGKMGVLGKVMATRTMASRWKTKAQNGRSRAGTAMTCECDGCSNTHRYSDGYCHLHRSLAAAPVVKKKGIDVSTFLMYS